MCKIWAAQLVVPTWTMYGTDDALAYWAFFMLRPLEPERHTRTVRHNTNTRIACTRSAYATYTWRYRHTRIGVGRSLYCVRYEPIVLTQRGEGYRLRNAATVEKQITFKRYISPNLFEEPCSHESEHSKKSKNVIFRKRKRGLLACKFFSQTWESQAWHISTRCG